MSMSRLDQLLSRRHFVIGSSALAAARFRAVFGDAHQMSRSDQPAHLIPPKRTPPISCCTTAMCRRWYRKARLPRP